MWLPSNPTQRILSDRIGEECFCQSLLFNMHGGPSPVAKSRVG